jgi:DNA helicase-2/ATP-dependent DNA helicase PcrA
VSRPTAPRSGGHSFSGQRRRRDSSAAGTAPFETGEAVRHPSFGEGTVIQVAQRGKDWDVTVAFKGRGIKTLALSFAKLEKV